MPARNCLKSGGVRAQNSGKNYAESIIVIVRLDALLVLAVLLTLLLGGCSKNIQNEEAVRSAVMEYLNARAPQTGLDMSAMTVQVSTMSFERDSARVTVSVAPKGVGGGMQINYELDRKGDKWVVRPNASPHMTVAPNGSEALPPGHPAVAPNGSQALPPGHPPVAKQ
jgi:outer membrane murein-binding lipoprotein Lpp